MNIDVITITMLCYAFVFGWIIHSKRRNIIWFFKDNYIAIIGISVWIVLPLSAFAVFWINVYIWESNLIVGISIATMLATSLSYFWILRKTKKLEESKG